jgi:hypothetical protein
MNDEKPGILGSFRVVWSNYLSSRVAGSVAAIVFGVMILIMSIVAATTPARVFPASGMRVIRLAQ